MNKNIFVVGLDELNIQDLTNIEYAERYNFIPLLEGEDVRLKLKGAPISYKDLVDAACRKLDQHKGGIDGIISFIDPAMLLTYYLCEQYGMKAPSLKSGIYSEHKFLSRKEQKKVIPDNIPSFDIIDPFAPKPISELELETPFWLKPVISYGGQLAFQIHDQNDLDNSLAIIRNEIGFFSEPYNYLLSIADLPDHIKKAHADCCIAENAISGLQYTLEGYVYNKNVEVYAFFESPLYKGTSSFLGYITPAGLPDSVKDRMAKIAEDVMLQIDFDHSPFNIEFHYDHDSDRIWLLEINSRISESHSCPFALVYGHSNHEFLVKLATGEPPAAITKSGKYEIAGKIYYRVFFHDGLVTYIPPASHVEKIANEFDARIVIQVKKGQKLSELKGQDSYSYSLADIYLGAHNPKELYKQFEQIVEKLNIVVEELDADH